MAVEPLVWYCQPLQNAARTKLVDGAFGAYTPCAISSGVLLFSHLVLLGLCCYRIWLIKKNSKVQRFSLSSEYYCYILGFLAGYCTIEPILRLLMGSSIFNLDGTTGLAPYEVSFCIFKFNCWRTIIALKTDQLFLYAEFICLFHPIYLLYLVTVRCYHMFLLYHFVICYCNIAAC